MTRSEAEATGAADRGVVVPTANHTRGPGRPTRGVDAERASWLQRCLLRDHAVRAQEFAELTHEVTHLRRELAAIHASTTWRATAPARAVVTRLHMLARGWTATLEKARRSMSPHPERSLDRRPRETGSSLAGQEITPAEYQRWIAQYDEISDGDIAAIRDLLDTFPSGPLISVLLRVANPSTAYLDEAIKSVLAQVHSRWELCIAYEASAAPDVRTLLRMHAASERRVKLGRVESSDIAATSNAALKLASGEWAVILDDSDRLRPHSLFMIATELALHPDADFVYSDEDTIDDLGRRSVPYFKPDWDPLLLLGQNYLGHLSAFRRKPAVEAGGFRSEFDGGQDLDLFLRLLSDVPEVCVRHIRHVLYHSRGHVRSPESRHSRRSVPIDTPARRVVQAQLIAHGERAHVVDIANECLSIRFAAPEPAPLVDVIVPTTADPRVSEPCLDGLLGRTSYPRFRVVLVCSERNTGMPGRSAFLDGVTRDDRVTLLTHDDRPFSWAWTNNFACRHSQGSVLCFLNDDTSVIDANWLDAMVAHVLRDDVGAVGPMLYYPNDTIQHGGVILGAFGLAGHRYMGLSRGAAGANGRALVSQEVSAVTGACMVVRREAFASVGGFDERFEINFNDIDFCLRLRKMGWKVVWTPIAELYHRQSESVGLHYTSEQKGKYDMESEIFRQRWNPLLVTDPFYNPNLALDNLSGLAFPPRVRYPWSAGARLTTL